MLTAQSPANGFPTPLWRGKAGVLEAVYAEVPVVILLQGWPYDFQSYVEVSEQRSRAGYRVIVPYVRGYGATRFLSDHTARNAPLSPRDRERHCETD